MNKKIVGIVALSAAVAACVAIAYSKAHRISCKPYADCDDDYEEDESEEVFEDDLDEEEEEDAAAKNIAEEVNVRT